MTTAKAALVSSMTENDLLLAVGKALTLYGWLWSHHRRSDWGQHMGMAGLPDIVGVHPSDGRLLLLELKSATGVVSPDQHRWAFALGKGGNPVRYLWPKDLDVFLKDPYVTGAR